MDTRANRNHLKMMSEDLRDIQVQLTKSHSGCTRNGTRQGRPVPGTAGFSQLLSTKKMKKLYMDTRANRNHLKMMSEDLRDIQASRV